MSHYVDYAQEADNHRKKVARSYYRSRKNARQAAEQYAMIKVYQQNRDFFVRHPDLAVSGTEVTSYDRLINSTIRLGDTLLNSAFTDHDRARFYAQLARDYDELAARRNARLANG